MTNQKQVEFSERPDGVSLSFLEAIYPKEAIFGAAYALIDRCYIHLERDGDRFIVYLRPKQGVALNAQDVAGTFENEVLTQAWRRSVVEDNKSFLDLITSQLLLNAAGSSVATQSALGKQLDGTDADPFDDPLGIAVSWEEKYGQPTKSSESVGASESQDLERDEEVKS